MGRAAKLKKERRKMQIHQETNRHLSNHDWLSMAKHFEEHGEQVLDENFQPIEFESTEEHARYLENKFGQSSKANSAAIKNLMAQE